MITLRTICNVLVGMCVPQIIIQSVQGHATAQAVWIAVGIIATWLRVLVK